MRARGIWWSVVVCCGLAPAGCSPVGDSPAVEPADTGVFHDPNAPALKTGVAADKKEPLTKAQQVDENFRAAIEAIRAKDNKLAEEKLDEVLAGEPDHRDALVILGELTQQRALGLQRPANNEFYHKSARLFRTLAKVHGDLTRDEQRNMAMVLYNEACTFALEKKPEDAVQALRDALDAGFDQLELLVQDKELESLRARDDFKKVVDSALAKERNEALARARAELVASREFPFDFKLEDVDGKKHRLADLKGKVTIVDFWGTWCPPCRQEIPHFVALYEKFHGDGLAIIGVNYEQADDAEARSLIRAFVAKEKVPYPCLLGDTSTRNQVPGFSGFPTTLFLDGAGKVRLRWTGYHPRADLEAVVSILLEDVKGAGEFPKTTQR